MMMSSGIDLPGADQGNQRQLRRGRIAAGVGHQPRLADGGALHFGQAIDGLALQRHGAVFVTVPLGVGPGVGQAEVGGKVDDLQMAGQARDHLLGSAVGQAAEGDVDPRPVDLVIALQDRQGTSGEVGESGGDRLAGAALRRERADTGVRMIAESSRRMSSAPV